MYDKHGFFSQRQDIELQQIETPRLKVVFVGKSGVGKTCLFIGLQQLKHFDEHQESTIGMSFTEISFSKNQIIYRLGLWDTAGQERYRSVTKVYMRNAFAVLLCYDITNRDSFNQLPIWLEEIRSENYDHPIILLANKIDLNNSRVISSNEGTTFQKENNIPIYIECSAKQMCTCTGKNQVNNILDAITSFYDDKHFTANLDHKDDSVNLLAIKEARCIKTKTNQCC